MLDVGKKSRKTSQDNGYQRKDGPEFIGWIKAKAADGGFWRIAIYCHYWFLKSHQHLQKKRSFPLDK
jgi:hypothetical protein